MPNDAPSTSSPAPHGRLLADLRQLARPRHARWDELGLMAVRSTVLEQLPTHGPVANTGAAALLPGLSRAMGSHVKPKVLPVPFKGRALPDVRLSDHSPFWDAGYNAVMVTLDLPFLMAVIDGLEEAIGGC